MVMKAPTKPFALCIDNAGYQASLVPGKIYRILPDPKAAKDHLVRIVDQSGEDYLYHGEDYLFHKDHFVFVDFPPGKKARKKGVPALSLFFAPSDAKNGPSARVFAPPGFNQSSD